MTSFVAKISDNNAPSLALFKSLGYYVECEEPAFNEIHLRYDVPEGGVHLTARYDVLPWALPIDGGASASAELPADEGATAAGAGASLVAAAAAPAPAPAPAGGSAL